MSGVSPSHSATTRPPAVPDRALAALRASERRRRARLRAWLYRRVAVFGVWLLWVGVCWTHRQTLVALLPRLVALLPRRGGSYAPPPAPMVSEALVCLPSVRWLSEAELAPRSDWELTLMRNEPYARHGYQFGQGQGAAPIYAYFARLPWYRPDTRDLDVCWERLSSVEKANAFLLLRCQQQRRRAK